MNFLGSMRLSTRIYLQQILLVLALVGASLFALYGVDHISGEARQIKEVNLPMAQAMSEAASQRLRQNRNYERILRYGPDIQRSEKARDLFEKVVTKFRNHDDNVNKYLAEAAQWAEKVAVHNAEDGSQSQRLDMQGAMATMEEIGQQQKAFRQDMEAIITDFNAGRVDQALVAGEKLEDSVSDNNAKIEKFVQQVGEVQASPVADINAATSSLRAKLLTILILAIVLATVMMIYTGLTLGGLRRAMGNIGNSVQQVASAASQSSNAISVVADGAKQQSEAIAQAVTAVSQSAAVLGEVSRSAEESRAMAQEGVQIIQGSQEQMARTVAVINRIVDNSGKINKITDVIDNIASQTNMLSLNAAIEAARAGEQGKGFAVVAEQVRKLAESSRSSVQDIMELVQQAARDANEAVQAAGKMDAEMNGIARSANASVNLMVRISTAMEEQVATVAQLQHNMDSLKAIGNNNANAAEEITQTVLEMSHIADDTNTEVRKFNI